MNHKPAFLQLVESIKPSIQEITLTELQHWQQTDKAFTLIDVREESEWQKGHLPNAIHLSKGVIERDIETQVPNNSAILVLYCGGGFRSALAASNLQKMGYSHVYSLIDGYRGWIQATSD